MSYYINLKKKNKGKDKRKSKGLFGHLGTLILWIIKQILSKVLLVGMLILAFMWALHYLGF